MNDPSICKVCYSDKEPARETRAFLCSSCKNIYRKNKMKFDQNEFFCSDNQDCVISHGVGTNGCIKCRMTKTEAIIKSTKLFQIQL